MNRLDTEIREAMGALADAAPAALSPDELVQRAERASTTSTSGSSRNRVLMAAASLVAVVSVAVVLVAVSGGDDDQVATDPTSISTTAPPTTDAGLASLPPVAPETPEDPELPNVEIDPDGITIAAGAIFGLVPGSAVSADDVLAAVTPRLGEPDVDSGWLPAKRLPCEGLTEYRELWWGDLSFGLWETGSRTYLQHWSVGDRRFGLFPVPDVDAPTDPTPTGLATEAGVRVGDPLGAIPVQPNVRIEAWPDNDGDPFQSDEAVLQVWVSSANPEYRPSGLAPESRSGRYLVIGSSVAAFGAESYSC